MPDQPRLHSHASISVPQPAPTPPQSISQISEAVMNHQLHIIATSKICPAIKELRVMVAYATHSFLTEYNICHGTHVDLHHGSNTNNMHNQNSLLSQSKSLTSLTSSGALSMTSGERRTSMRKSSKLFARSIGRVMDSNEKGRNLSENPLDGTDGGGQIVVANTQEGVAQVLPENSAEEVRTESPPPEAPPLVPPPASSPPPLAKTRSRRSSIDLNREKLIQAEFGGSGSASLSKGRPTEATLEFCVAMVLAIYAILNKLSAGTTQAAKAAQSAIELSDEEIFIISAKQNGSYKRLMEIYKWYEDVIPKLRLQELLEGDGNNSRSASSLAFSALGGNKKRGLATTQAIPLDQLLKNEKNETGEGRTARTTTPVENVYNHHHNCWLPHEVSDAIACLYECKLYDIENPAEDDDSPIEFPEFVMYYFKKVYANSRTLNKVEKFVNGIKSHCNNREFGTRIHVFGVLCGVIKCKEDSTVNPIGYHSEASSFVLDIIRDFTVGENRVEEECEGESDLERMQRDGKSIGEKLRTDDKKTMVRCLQPGAISFRTSVKRLIKRFPAVADEVFDVNGLLSELEAKCVKVSMVPMIDLDWMVMKLLTVFYRVYGGKTWHKMQNLCNENLGSRGTRGRRGSSLSMDTPDGTRTSGGGVRNVMSLRRGSAAVGGLGGLFEENEKAQREKEEAEAKARVDELMEEFRETKAYELMAAWLEKRREEIRLRKEREREEEEKKKAYEREPYDIFAEEDEEEKMREINLAGAKELPKIFHVKGNRNVCKNRFNKAGEEVCFEEFRAHRNRENMKKNVSVMIRTKLNQQCTMRIAPFDSVEDVIATSKIGRANPDKMYILVHDGIAMDGWEQVRTYKVKNNACLKIYEAHEWDEVQQAMTGQSNADMYNGL